MPFPEGALDVSDISERVGVRIQDGDHIVKSVVEEISGLVTRSAASLSGAAKIARGYTTTHARAGYYLHAFVADTIAKHYEQQRDN